MSHTMMVLALGGKLHLAPIGDSPQRILDIGTGTGIWAIEMGKPSISGSLPCCQQRPLIDLQIDVFARRQVPRIMGMDSHGCARSPFLPFCDCGFATANAQPFRF